MIENINYLLIGVAVISNVNMIVDGLIITNKLICGTGKIYNFVSSISKCKCGVCEYNDRRNIRRTH